MSTPSRGEIIDAHEKELDAVRRLFDMYFQGLEKKPPQMRYATLKATLMRLRAECARWNTADRFRVASIQQRFSTYDRMWTRQLQEMEEGTHRRDRFRVQRMRAAAEADTAPPPPPPPGTSSGETPELPLAAAAAREGERPGRPRPAPSPGAPAAAEDARLRRLYDVYMTAKRRTGERTTLSYEGLVAQLRKQEPTLRQKYNCDAIDYKVVLKDGKAVLKAVPRP